MGFNDKVNFRFLALGIVVFVLIGTLFWTWVVVSYEPELTTENTFQVSDDESEVSNQSTDKLVTVEIKSGADILGWDQLSVSLTNDGNEYPCSLTGISTVQQNGSKVSTRLTADGNTFSIQVDATSEESFVGLNLATMKETEVGNHSIRFSKTDIFLGGNSTALAIEDQSYSEINSIPNGTFNLDDSERLEWYDYDFSVHRVNPKEQVYVIQESNITYKLQFISYYNEDDESRHIQLIVGWLSGDPLPAFDDSSLIAESPCIIEGAESTWSVNQIISIRENGIDICNEACTVKIDIQYQGVNVKAISKVEVV